jgi:hypothetical protein
MKYLILLFMGIFLNYPQLVYARFEHSISYNLGTDLADNNASKLYDNELSISSGYVKKEYSIEASTSFQWFVVDDEITVPDGRNTVENSGLNLSGDYSFVNSFGVKKLKGVYGTSLYFPSGAQEDSESFVLLSELSATYHYKIAKNELSFLNIATFPNESTFPSGDTMRYQGLHAIGSHSFMITQKNYFNGFTPSLTVGVSKNYTEYEVDPGTKKVLTSHAYLGSLSFTYDVFKKTNYAFSLYGKKSVDYFGSSLDSFAVKHLLSFKHKSFIIKLSYGYKSRLVSNEMNYDYWYLDSDEKYTQAQLVYLF